MWDLKKKKTVTRAAHGLDLNLVTGRGLKGSWNKILKAII